MILINYGTMSLSNSFFIFVNWKLRYRPLWCNCHDLLPPPPPPPPPKLLIEVGGLFLKSVQVHTMLTLSGVIASLTFSYLALNSVSAGCPRLSVSSYRRLKISFQPTFGTNSPAYKLEERQSWRGTSVLTGQGNAINRAHFCMKQ